MNPIDLIPAPYRLLALAGAVVALSAASFSGGWAVNGWRLGSEIQGLKTQHAQAVADANKLSLAASETYRRTEQEWGKQRTEAQNALRSEVDKNKRVAGEFAAYSLRQRTAISDFAAGGGPAHDTVAACRADAATLGDVLADALHREEDATAAAETHAASTRALLAAWPR